MYTTHQLSSADANTIKCPAQGISYIPIPKSAGPNFAGLLTIDLPPSVHKGEKYSVIVKQITSASRSGGKIAINRGEDFNKGKQGTFSWQRVLGVFHLSIPVSTKALLLHPEERLLSVLRWIEKAIPSGNRWLPVFKRYVGQIADRVTFMGGNPYVVEQIRMVIGKKVIRVPVITMEINIIVTDINMIIGSMMMNGLFPEKLRA